MSINNCFELSLSNKNQLAVTVEALEIELQENMKIFEDILKDSSGDNNSRLEKQINTCFELECKLEDYSDKLKELESMGNCVKSPNTLIDFIPNIPNVESDLGPEALIVVTSEKFGLQYIQLMQGLGLRNVMITTIRALTAGEVNVTLGNVKTALLDGSEAEYREFLGSVSVRLVIADHVPADRLFRVWDDGHRDQCFATIRMKGLHGRGRGDDNNCNER